jgi:hypothetical protein
MKGRLLAPGKRRPRSRRLRGRIGLMSPILPLIHRSQGQNECKPQLPSSCEIPLSLCMSTLPILAPNLVVVGVANHRELIALAPGPSTATKPAMRRRGHSSYLVLDPVPLPLPSQPHSTALPSPNRYEEMRCEDRYMKREANELPRTPSTRSSQNAPSSTWVNSVR